MKADTHTERHMLVWLEHIIGRGVHFLSGYVEFPTLGKGCKLYAIEKGTEP
jgi:hypothetical protein